MLRFRNELPLDYSLCSQQVIVYHREGLTDHLDGVLFEPKVEETTQGAVTDRSYGFLLIVPYENRLQPGDRICQTRGEPGYTVRSVKNCTFQGRFCHTEARG